jgi:hypothetical protein
MADTRTAAQKLADMTLYGPCMRCGAARTTRKTVTPDGGTLLEMACPAGCAETTMAEDLDEMRWSTDG